jgi:hypothetical protein
MYEHHQVAITLDYRHHPISDNPIYVNFADTLLYAVPGGKVSPP